MTKWLASLIVVALLPLSTDAQVERLIKQLSGKPDVAAMTTAPSVEDYRQAIDHLIPLLVSPDLRERYAPQMMVQEICSRAGRPGAERERDTLCRVLCSRLPRAPLPAQVWIVRQLELIGKAETVRTLQSLVTHEDRELRDAARRALQNNPSRDAGKALLRLLKRTGNPEVLAGVLYALGERGDQGAVKHIVPFLVRDNALLADTAAEALGQIASDRALAALRSNRKPGAHDAITQALLRAARQGRRPEAIAVYSALDTPGEPLPVRIAAFNGLIAGDPDNAISYIVEALLAGGPDKQATAIQAAQSLDRPSLNKTLLDLFPDLSALVQVQFLGFMGDRADRSARPVMLQSLKSPDLTVRLAAMNALGSMGNADCVRALLKVAASTSDEEQKTARQVLARMAGEGVDEELVQQAKSGGTDLRVEAIDLCVGRQCREVIPHLLSLADKTGMDEKVLKAGYRAVGVLGTDDLIPTLADQVAKPSAEAVRKHAESALKILCDRAKDKDAVTAILVKRIPDADAPGKASLLKTLSATGGENALALVTRFTKDPNEKIRDAALRTLSQWPDFEVVETLLAIASNTETETKHHVLAIRGIVRLVDSAKNTPVPKQVETIRALLEIARRAEEQKILIASLGRIEHPAALKAFGTLLDNETLRPDAALAGVQLAEKLATAKKEAAGQLADKILSLDISPELNKRAEALLDKPVPG